MRRSLSCFAALGTLALCACGDDETTSPTTAAATTTTTGDAATTTGTGGAGGGATTSGTGGQGGMADAPPGSPLGLDATLQPTPFAVDLAWQAPSDDDIAGYLVARSLTAPAGGAGPQSGTTYNVDDPLAGFGSVIFVGPELVFEDLAPGPGAGVVNYYSVWAIDDAGQYSAAPASDLLDVPIPGQTGTIQIATPTGTPVVTVTTQPLYGTLSGTATYDAVTGLTLSLQVENRAARIVYNTKAVVDSVSDAAATIVSDGKDAAGNVAAYYGPEAMDIGASKSRNFVLTGALGTVDPIVIDLHLASNPAGFSGDDYNASHLAIHDLSGAKDVNGAIFGGIASFDNLGYKPGVGHLKGGFFSPDGRFFYAGHKNMPYVSTIDMTTLTAVAGTDISKGATGLGFTNGPVKSPDGKTVYVVVTTGGHQFDDAGDGTLTPAETHTREIDLVQMDLETMAETGRLHLLSAPAPVVDGNTHYPKGAEIAITPDGARAVVPVHGAGMIWMVDLATLTLIDTDAVTAGVQGIDTSATSMSPRVTAIAPDGTKAYVGHAHGEDDITVIDLADYSTTTMTSSSAVGANGYGWGSFLFGPTDGKLYIARPYNGTVSLSIYDPGTQMYNDVVLPNNRPMGLGFLPDGTQFYVFDDQNMISAFDTATSTQIDVDGDAANGITSFGTLEIEEGHAIGVTPF